MSSDWQEYRHSGLAFLSDSDPLNSAVEHPIDGDDGDIEAPSWGRKRASS